jgi:protein phosphatase
MALSHSIRAFALTDKGKVRAGNEDAFLCRPQAGLFAVADGMGGHAGGATASAAIVEALSRVEPQNSAGDLRRLAEEALHDAHRDILLLAEQRGLGTIGSTVVALLMFEDRYACLWAGDSRAYLLRGDDIVQITRDHTEVAQLVADGLLSAEEARSWPRRNVITRAVGAGDALLLDFVSGELVDGDRFVLCSDGLTGHVAAEEIGRLAAGRSPQNACRELVEMALQCGGSDNITVLVAAYELNADAVCSGSAQHESRDGAPSH